ncbi:MAG: alpha/beta hydrolase, partial [Tomitella sp.]|nr:alpha/beta hydrolase [Tomitella sp.]
MIDPRIDALYNVRRTVTPKVFDANMAAYRSRSDNAVRGLAGHQNVEYDAESAKCLDIWGIGDTPRPAVVMI